jgi:hypothetical protein
MSGFESFPCVRCSRPGQHFARPPLRPPPPRSVKACCWRLMVAGARGFSVQRPRSNMGITEPKEVRDRPASSLRAAGAGHGTDRRISGVPSHECLAAADAPSDSVHRPLVYGTALAEGSSLACACQVHLAPRLPPSSQVDNLLKHEVFFFDPVHPSGSESEACLLAACLLDKTPSGSAEFESCLMAVAGKAAACLPRAGGLFAWHFVSTTSSQPEYMSCVSAPIASLQTPASARPGCRWGDGAPRHG